MACVHVYRWLVQGWIYNSFVLTIELCRGGIILAFRKRAIRRIPPRYNYLGWVSLSAWEDLPRGERRIAGGNPSKWLLIPRGPVVISTGQSLLPLGLSGRRGIVVACVCPFVRPSVCNTFVRTITFDQIELGSPNLAQICTLAMPWMGLFMARFTLYVRTLAKCEFWTPYAKMKLTSFAHFANPIFVTGFAKPI